MTKINMFVNRTKYSSNLPTPFLSADKQAYISQKTKKHHTHDVLLGLPVANGTTGFPPFLLAGYCANVLARSASSSTLRFMSLMRSTARLTRASAICIFTEASSASASTSARSASSTLAVASARFWLSWSSSSVSSIRGGAG